MTDTTTPITPEERVLLKKVHMQGWDIDEGNMSVYRDVDGSYVPLSDLDGPAETARELAHVWQSAWPIVQRLLTALEAAEARKEEAESSLARAFTEIGEMSAGIEKIAEANHALAAKAQTAEAENAKLQEQVSALLELNDATGDLLDACIDEDSAIAAHDDDQTGRTLETETRLKNVRARLFAAYDKGTKARAKCEALGLKVTPSQQGPHDA